MTSIDKLKKEFDREIMNILGKYATKFYKKGYCIVNTNKFVKLKKDNRILMVSSMNEVEN